jgi:hypothetical protein
MIDYITDEKNSREYALLFCRLKKNREKKKEILMMTGFPLPYKRQKSM